MLLRYPGNGKSTPVVCTFATSVPCPPVGPPPAFATAAAGAACFFAPAAGLVGGTGVARLGCGVTGALICAAFGRGAISGVGRAAGSGVPAVVMPGCGVGTTTPAARGPGGAA